MKEMFSSVSPKGQVTLPVEVRRLLGIKPKDKVAFEIVDGQVRLASARFTVESAAGSVGPATRTEDFEQISQEAKEDHLERTSRKMHSA